MHMPRVPTVTPITGTAHHEQGEKRVGPVGLEPTTHGLKVRCSTN